MYSSYGLEARCDLGRLNKKLCTDWINIFFTAGVLLIEHCEHKWCIQIYFEKTKLMKLVSAQKKFEILGYPLLDFSGITTGDAQIW